MLSVFVEFVIGSFFMRLGFRIFKKDLLVTKRTMRDIKKELKNSKYNNALYWLIFFTRPRWIFAGMAYFFVGTIFLCHACLEFYKIIVNLF